MRVLIVADDPLARTGLAALLAGQPGLAAIEQTSPSVDLASTVTLHDPDLVVWDLGRNAGESAAPLAAIQDLDRPVVVLSDDESRVAEALAAGARGALPRHTDGALLLAALEAVAQGLVVIDPAFAPRIAPARSEMADALGEELTHRELEVLQLLAEGIPNKQIAQRLGISDNTVKFHITTIFSKLGAHSRTEAVIRAARQGLIVL